MAAKPYPGLAARTPSMARRKKRKPRPDVSLEPSEPTPAEAPAIGTDLGALIRRSGVEAVSRSGRQPVLRERKPEPTGRARAKPSPERPRHDRS